MTELARAVSAVERWLERIYRLELGLGAARFVIEPQEARRLLPARSPRSGVVVLEEDEQAFLGLYVDPRDRRDGDTIVEETSHLLCLAWHAAQDRPVSRRLLELQGEVDRYVIARLMGRSGFEHFTGFRWDDWMDGPTRRLYVEAHEIAQRYCRSLARRFPRRSDTPGLLAELRGFYRATPEAKLRAAA